jgi:hypothetical protein
MAQRPSQIGAHVPEGGLGSPEEVAGLVGGDDRLLQQLDVGVALPELGGRPAHGLRLDSQRLRHGVEPAGQCLDLPHAARRCLHVEVTGGDAGGGLVEQADGTQHRPAESHGHHHDPSQEQPAEARGSQGVAPGPGHRLGSLRLSTSVDERRDGEDAEAYHRRQQ